MSTLLDLLMIRAGVSYRQVDYWVRQGWIEPRFRSRKDDSQQDGGTGYVRDFEDHEQRVLIAMGRLVNAGLKPEVAAIAARSMVDRDEPWARLERGVIVALEGESNSGTTVTSRTAGVVTIDPLGVFGDG